MKLHLENLKVARGCLYLTTLDVERSEDRCMHKQPEDPPCMSTIPLFILLAQRTTHIKLHHILIHYTHDLLNQLGALSYFPPLNVLCKNPQSCFAPDIDGSIRSFWNTSIESW